MCDVPCQERQAAIAAMDVQIKKCRLRAYTVVAELRREMEGSI